MDKLKILALGLLLCLPAFAQQKFYVVYSKATGRVRSMVVPQFPKETVNAKTGTGEAVLSFPMSQYGSLPQIQALVTSTTGLTPANDRYAVVNSMGQVVNVIYADPVGCGDSIAGDQLVASQTAGVGWMYTGGVFIGPPVTHKTLGTATPPGQ